MTVQGAFQPRLLIDSYSGRPVPCVRMEMEALLRYQFQLAWFTNFM